MTALGFRVVWSAGRDGKAHARRSGAPRTACNLAAAVDLRWAWPEVSRCMACIDRVAEWARQPDRQPQRTPTPAGTGDSVSASETAAVSCAHPQVSPITSREARRG